MHGFLAFLLGRVTCLLTLASFMSAASLMNSSQSLIISPVVLATSLLSEVGVVGFSSFRASRGLPYTVAHRKVATRVDTWKMIWRERERERERERTM